MPWGQQITIPEGFRGYHSRCVKEQLRVIRPDG